MDSALKKKYHDDYYHWTTFGQTELEDHGFTCSTPKPVRPTKHPITDAWTTNWETTRESGIVSPNLIPVALHVSMNLVLSSKVSDILYHSQHEHSLL
jgi:hypothetical protein